MNKVAVSQLCLLWCLIVFIGITTGHYANAQSAKVPLLERTISVTFDGEPLEAALKKIGKAGNFNFSYKSTLFDEKQLVTASFSNKTVREVLDQVFKGNIDYRERGKYIILIKAEKQTSARDSEILSGYVIDEATGQRLKNVSVYDPVSLSSAVTDDYGYFKIEIKRPTGEDIKLAVKKSEYTDTLLVVPSRNRRLLNIPMKIDRDKISLMADSVQSKLKRLWLSTKFATEQAINMENISDTIYRQRQFSFVPFVGTNGALSGNVINDFSFNLLGGYSLGNTTFELGGWFNAVRGNVSGVQIAGLANGILGEQRGAQLAGLINLTGEDAHGVQFAGLANATLQNKKTVGVAGLMNFVQGNATSISIAGLANYVGKENDGPQLAGLFNFSGGNRGPAQVAGLFNFTAGQMRGVQFAGLFNYTDNEMKGAQFAGLFNISPSYIKGAQIGSVFNIAKQIDGVQVGLFNFSKDIKGVPIGLVSVVAKGYHKLEVSADEIFYTNLAFRTGVRQFYNILTVGARPDTFEDDMTVWSFGYGLGTAPKVTNWLSLNLDVTSNQIVHGKIEKIHLLNKAFAGLDFHLTKNLSIVAGVTLNGLVTNSTYDQYPDLFVDYEPSFIRDRDFSDDLNLKMWWGGKVGVRLF